MELARGTVSDRPWALTLATFARRGTSGQITLVGPDQKRYSIALDRGSIVAARSPMSADGVARVALTSRLVTPEHVAELARRQGAQHRDEVELLGDIARLTPPQVQRLRIDVTLRRAARTFAVEAGQYILEDKACLPVCGSEVDVRAVVYQGIRMHMTDLRIADELRQLGGTIFVLEPHAGSELHRFGFGEAEWPLLAAMRDPCNLPELEARLRDMDPRTMQAVIYALVACGTARVLSAGRTPTPPSVGRTPTPPSIARSTTPPNIARTLSPMDSRTPAPLSISRTKTNPELAAEAAERAARALEHDKPEDAVLELKKAVELVPNDVDYTALLGWALFCAADDKRSVAAIARKALESAIHKSDNPVTARFYLGRIERILGRHREALGHFQAVLSVQPDHRDASAEVRVIEARIRRESSTN